MPREINIPKFDLTGKTAIITGGARGLGFGLAATYASYGANVVITDIASNVNSSSAEIQQNYIKGSNRCISVIADSRKQEDIEFIIAQTIDAFGRIDILVNNAGISGKTANIISDECDEENFDKVIATNLKSVFMLTKAVVKQMIALKIGGRIINMASVGGLIGGKAVVAYGASKAGILSLTKTMANEFARYNITVNAICPGYVVTPLNEDVFANEEIRKKMEARTAVRRLGTIEEIAGPALAMASDSFSYMTGTYILLDGGQTIGG